MNEPVRILPPDVYDALEMSALVHGGIGSGTLFRGELDVPYCILGHGAFIEGLPLIAAYYTETPVATLLRAHFDDRGIVSDDAVRRILHRQGRRQGRVAFKRWCKELNVHRGSTKEGADK